MKMLYLHKPVDRLCWEIARFVLVIVHVLLNCRDELLTAISKHVRNKLYKVQPTAKSIAELKEMCEKLHRLIHHDLKFLHSSDMQPAQG